MNKEIRIANVSDFNIEFREAEESEKMIIEGYAAVFDEETLIGGEEYGFYERIAKGAFDEADMKDVPLKYNHSDNVPILARTRNKSLELKVDDKGLFIHAELLDTQDNKDMYKRIKAGLIDKMSFTFTVKANTDEWERGETSKRTITKFDRLFDVSVVDVPAYDGTSIYARSLELCETFKNAVETAESNKITKDYTVSNLIHQYVGKVTE